MLGISLFQLHKDEASIWAPPSLEGTGLSQDRYLLDATPFNSWTKSPVPQGTDMGDSRWWDKQAEVMDGR